ncbi:MAG: restriction endonuclease subunit S [Nitrosomonas sp.]|nr:restriction endonuclease subunit S [Nitrosomonas sp.]
MSFPRYESYKDSGVEWLGELPEHWEIKKIRRVISAPLINGIFKKKREFGKGVLLVNVFDIYQDDFKIKPDNLDRVRCEANEINTYQVLSGDLFFVRSSLKQEGVAVVAVAGDHIEPVVFECHLIRVRPDKTLLDARYGSYLLNSALYRYQLIARAKITTMTTIDQEAILSILLTAPPVPEQKIIASFLDCETTKIDELIGEQQRLIELLKEKRQAVISHAVTKGLNPDVPMKDSGIQWLGEVPEHWNVMALKRIASLKSGETITSNHIEETGEYPVYGGNGLRGYTSRYTHDGEYPLIGRQGALCGNINYAKGKFWASEHAVVVSLIKPLIIKWLGETLRAMNLNQYSVSAAQPGLSVEIVSNLPFPVPPFTEQQSIATFLDRETTKIEELITEAKQAIELLKERRTALISAAVTGKIDIRGATV